MHIITGQSIQIQSYKHDHTIHRIWKKSIVLETRQHMIITGNEHAQVIEANGRTWKTKEPAICFFFENYWFNVIAMVKSDGIHYYCNLASPFVIDSEGIKYIDYDLDIKLYPSKKFRILDKNEFDLHKKVMAYGEDIETIIHHQVDILKNNMLKQIFPFQDQVVYELLKQFKSYT